MLHVRLLAKPVLWIIIRRYYSEEKPVEVQTSLEKLRGDLSLICMQEE